MSESWLLTEPELAELAQTLSAEFQPGDIVLLEGPLGAGKTTWVRALLRAIGYDGPVRSPTFNLIQEFATDPPIMHADLYRVTQADDIGLEDYFATHVCLIEWPDRLGGLVDPEQSWRLTFEFVEDSDRRRMSLARPSG